MKKTDYTYGMSFFKFIIKYRIIYLIPIVLCDIIGTIALFQFDSLMANNPLWLAVSFVSFIYLIGLIVIFMLVREYFKRRKGKID